MTGRKRTLGIFGAAALIVLAAFLAGQRSLPSAEALFNDSDGDGANDVMERVSGSDPGDAHSQPEEFFWSVVSPRSACNDGQDNDGDGMADEADAGCVSDDDDELSNQLETNVGSDPNDSENDPENSDFDAALASLGFGFFQTCADGFDDDLDGATDADDSGCDVMLSDSDGFDDRTEKLFHSDPTDGSSVPEHEVPNPGSCSDGMDNDRDGMTDAAEMSCRAATNDNVAQARNITSIPFQDDVKISAATTEPDEPESECFFKPLATVWYTYTPAASGALAVDTAGSDFANVVTVFTRSGGEYSEVACAQSIGGTGARASFHASAGETYYIQVAGDLFTNSPADLHLELDVGHPPANDNFADAEAITSLPFKTSPTVSDATTEFGEPSGDCTGDESYSTVWYSYAAASNALLVASTSGSTFPQVISVLTDSPFGLSEIACVAYDPRVAIEVEAGRTYFIQVGAIEEGLASLLHFSLEAGQPPANDDFTDARNVTLPFEETVDTFTATSEGAEPDASCSIGLPSKTVWYKTTAQQSGYIGASMPGEPFERPPAALAVYQGSSLASLTEVACTSPFFSEADTAVFQATAGETYYFQLTAFALFFEGGGVEPAGGTAGFSSSTEITVRIESFVVPACAPSAFTKRPAGEPLVFGPPEDALDLTSVSGGSDGTNYCLRLQFDRPLPPPTGEFGQPSFGISVGFDTDMNPATGYESALAWPCDGGLGSEIRADITSGQVVVPIDIFGDFIPFPGEGGGPPQSVVGFAIYNERSVYLVIPMEALGSTSFRFGASIGTSASSECVPRAGGLTVPGPEILGDPNCDGDSNTLDSALLLQRFAGLLTRQLPCEYLGDVNGNGDAGPIDAVLILQYEAGMISEF